MHWIRVLSAGALLLGLSSAAKAEVTDWVRGAEARKVAHALRGKLLQKIECRDLGGTEIKTGTIEFRVTYADNPNGVRFMWAVGNRFGPIAARARKHGYKLVSYEQFVRQRTGLKYRCGVWHQP